ncbi:MAG: peptidase [Bacteroidota bacterium]
MTYCLGIKVRSGLVALADTRITSGSHTTTSKKITTHQFGKNSLFIMTSGLRSVRDKAVTYFEETINEKSFQYDKVYKVVNAFGDQLRKVAREDKQALIEAGLLFNLYGIVGGQLEGDETHKLFLLYPEGNWIEIGPATPFTIIGNAGYGQPILNRVITFDSTIRFAVKASFLSFDSTRVSANDVGYPIDLVVYKEGTYKLVEQRFSYEELKEIGWKWEEMLESNIDSLSDNWINGLID